MEIAAHKECMKETAEYREGADKYLEILYAPYEDFWEYSRDLSDAAWDLRLTKRYEDGTS